MLSASKGVSESLGVILGARVLVEHRERLADARNLLAAQPFDVVIVDTELGDCDGAVAIREIVRGVAGPSLIALTLNAKFNGLPPEESGGLFAYLSKPFEAEQVRFVIDRAIERADLHRRIVYLNKQVGMKEQLPALAEPDSPDPQREFALFRRCAKIFARDVHVPMLATALAEVLAEEFLVASVGVFLWDHETRRFAPATAYGLDEQVLADAAFRPGSGIAGWLNDNGVVLRRARVATTFSYEAAMGVVREFDLLRAELVVPMLRRGQLYGFISLGPRVSGRPISEAEVEWLVLVAGMASVAIENCEARRALAFEKLCAERIVAGLDAGVVAADAKGTITACNHAAAEALGLAGSPVGANVSVLGETLARLANDVLRSAERRAAPHIEHEATARRLQVSAAPVAGAGEAAGVVLVLEPAPDRAPGRAPAEAVGRSTVEDAAQMAFWSELAARMAHKLKNPLVSIKTFTQLLPERYAEDEFRTNFLDVVDAEADKINEIADRLLLYAEAHETTAVPTDLTALVETVLGSFAARAEASGVGIEREVDELPVVMADAERLGLALRAVVENALDAMPDGGRLVVRAHLVEAPVVVRTGQGRMLDFTDGTSEGGPGTSFVSVQVGDTGGGIQREHLDNVFQPFFSQSVRGIGLGLAIVARVVREHRGRVEITSAPGRGTQVRILLPVEC